MSRLLIVSNRLPLTVKCDRQRFTVTSSAGGLATGLKGPHERSDGLWLGWPGDTSPLDETQRAALETQLLAQRYVPLHLSPAEVSRYYEGFSNGVLWPLFHYMLDRIPLHARDWNAYRAVNHKFADLVARSYRPGDRIWVHDYQLTLLPAMLRKRLPDARIGFFLHIPFPSAEAYRTLPWREELLEGLLGADLVGFHTLAYCRHFANALLSTLGLSPDMDRVRFRGREVRFAAFPMGVDAAELGRMAESEAVAQELETIRRGMNGQRIILGVDRLDYTKGIPRRLAALERLLEREPSLRGKVCYVQVAVPSRTRVGEYAALREQVDQLVGRINGAYGSATSTPIHYLFRSISQRHLVALYRAADVMLVTPLRDGMNLVAKEFVACRTDDDGVLVLSELAGAAAELGEALLVNPYDTDGVARAVARALSMGAEERRTRMRALRRRVLEHNVHRWVERFLAELDAPAAQPAPELSLSSAAEVEQVAERIRQAGSLLLLLDYDGTLVDFAGHPELAAPDPALRRLLQALAQRPGTEVHVMSGRTPELLERWLGGLNIALHAEHGLWSRMRPDQPWSRESIPADDWKPLVRAILAQLAARVPGSFLEEKSASLAWHYRMADAELAEAQAKELKLHLTHTLANHPVTVLSGLKVVEVVPHGVSKSAAAQRVVAGRDGLVVAIGDDETDEHLFDALPEGNVAIHVGPRASRACLRLPDVTAVRLLLRSLLHGRSAFKELEALPAT